MAEKIKDSLTWGETLHNEAWRPHVCGPPLLCCCCCCCCCHSSLWWVKRRFTFYSFSYNFSCDLCLCSSAGRNIEECLQTGWSDEWVSGWARSVNIRLIFVRLYCCKIHFGCSLIMWQFEKKKKKENHFADFSLMQIHLYTCCSGVKGMFSLNLTPVVINLTIHKPGFVTAPWIDSLISPRINGCQCEQQASQNPNLHLDKSTRTRSRWIFLPQHYPFNPHFCVFPSSLPFTDAAQ